MPKEELCLSKGSSCATFSKDAENKRNSSTLLAIRDTKDTGNSSRSGSRCSSEKDSGYSDNGSDWQQTDVEDQQGNRSQSKERAETASQSGHNQEHGQRNPGDPTLMPAGHELPPIYIITHMPAMIQKRGQVLGRNRTKETTGSCGTHMILFQQPTLMPASLQLHKSASRKTNIKGKKISGTHLPFLSSFPRIAPHPGKMLLDKSSSKSLIKRVCTKHESDHTPVAGNLLDQHLYKQPKLAFQTSSQTCSSSTKDSLSLSSPTGASSREISSLCTTSSSFRITRRLHRNSNTSTRYCHFLNTVEILKQSGLLDITLRTKELLRQSSAADQDIAQLRQHTELLFQAACNSSYSLNDITACENLHRAMEESGSYPNLKILQSSRPDSASIAQSITIGDFKGPLPAENSGTLLTTIPDPHQNYPVAQQPHIEQRNELEARKESSEKVTFMSPDSSTG